MSAAGQGVIETGPTTISSWGGGNAPSVSIAELSEVRDVVEFSVKRLLMIA